MGFLSHNSGRFNFGRRIAVSLLTTLNINHLPSMLIGSISSGVLTQINSSSSWLRRGVLGGLLQQKDNNEKTELDVSNNK